MRALKRTPARTHACASWPLQPLSFGPGRTGTGRFGFAVDQTRDTLKSVTSMCTEHMLPLTHAQRVYVSRHVPIHNVPAKESEGVRRLHATLEFYVEWRSYINQLVRALCPLPPRIHEFLIDPCLFPSPRSAWQGLYTYKLEDILHGSSAAVPTIKKILNTAGIRLPSDSRIKQALQQSAKAYLGDREKDEAVESQPPRQFSKRRIRRCLVTQRTVVCVVLHGFLTFPAGRQRTEAQANPQLEGGVCNRWRFGCPCAGYWPSLRLQLARGTRNRRMRLCDLAKAEAWRATAILLRVILRVLVAGDHPMSLGGL